MINNSFLATTALTEFWDTTQSVLFLGDWCKTQENKAIYDTLQSTILNHYHLDQRLSLDSYHYTVNVYENLMPFIAEWLNRLHKTHYSIRYWQIIVGPFLLWYIQVIYDRYQYLRIAYSLYPDLVTIGMLETSFTTPINTLEFYLFATESDAWNLQIFTQLINLSFKKIQQVKQHYWDKELHQRNKTFGKPIHFKKLTKLKINCLQLLSKLNTAKSTGMFFGGISNKYFYQLMMGSRFRVFPIIEMHSGEEATLRANRPDFTMRSTLTDIKAFDDLSSLVLQTLPVNMPLNFIEYYEEECSLSEKAFPYEFNTIVAAGWNVNEHLKFWGAKHAEHGTKLIDIQHGGGYGTHLYSSREYLERKNCDGFISWGWKDAEDVIPAPASSACEKLTAHQEHSTLPKNDNCLWVTNEVPRYLVSLDNSLHSLEKQYLDTQIQFAKRINSALIPSIIMRVRPGSRLLYDLREQLPELTIQEPVTKESFFAELCAARLFIGDNLQTTFLYALAFNIPTIVFCNMTLSMLNAEAKPFFDLLKSVGIFYDSPEAAAEMVNEIAYDPLPWWNSESVQIARKKFCDKYVRVEKNWLKEWRDVLIGVQNRDVGEYEKNLSSL